MAVEQRLYTVEEFEQVADSPENADRLLELVDGEIVEKVPTEEHGLIAMNIAAALWNWNSTHKLGRIGTEVRHRSASDARNARLPDVSFSSSKRPLIKRGSVPEMPSLAVEIQSPNDSIKDMRESARFYLANGSKAVWLVFPEKRLVEVYSSTEELILTATDTLTGGELLPDFAMPVADVFRDPLDPAETAENPSEASE